MTAAERSAYMRAYRQTHRAEIAEQQKSRRQTRLVAVAAYRKANRAAILVKKKVYRETHRAQIAAYQKAHQPRRHPSEQLERLDIILGAASRKAAELGLMVSEHPEIIAERAWRVEAYRKDLAAGRKIKYIMRREED